MEKRNSRRLDVNKRSLIPGCETDPRSVRKEEVENGRSEISAWQEGKEKKDAVTDNQMCPWKSFVANIPEIKLFSFDVMQPPSSRMTVLEPSLISKDKTVSR